MSSISIRLASGRNVAALAWGRPSAPVRCICLHGWMDNSASFHLLGPALAEAADAYVVALDFAGHGKSYHLAADAFYTVAEYASDTVEASTALGWDDEPFFLIGHSLGAGVGSTVAGAFPDRVKGFVCIEAIGLLARPAEAAPTSLRNAILQRVKFHTGARRKLRTYPTVEDAGKRRMEMASMLPGKQSLTWEAALSLATRGTEPHADGGFVFCHDRRIMNASPSYFTEEQVEAFLEAITCPSLVFLSESGMFVDPKRVALMKVREEILSRNAKAFTCLRVAGDHHPHASPATAPPINSAVIEFVNKYSKEPPAAPMRPDSKVSGSAPSTSSSATTSASNAPDPSRVAFQRSLLLGAATLCGLASLMTGNGLFSRL